MNEAQPIDTEACCHLIEHFVHLVLKKGNSTMGSLEKKVGSEKWWLWYRNH